MLLSSYSFAFKLCSYTHEKWQHKMDTKLMTRVDESQLFFFTEIKSLELLLATATRVM